MNQIAQDTDDKGLTQTVCDVMTSRAAAVPPWITVADARKVAALRAVEHLLIEHGGSLLGIVSGIDLGAAGGDEAVGTLAKPLHLSVRPATPLERARDLMIKNRVSSLPVLAGAWLVGLVTRDAVERALRARDRLSDAGALVPVPAAASQPDARPAALAAGTRAA